MSDKAAAKNERISNVIKALNTARGMELLVIHQYMNQHYNLDNLDYGEFAAKMKLIAIDEMRHAESFAERIKELGGEPTNDLADNVVKGQEVRKIFAFDEDLEDNTLEVYNKFLAVCRENGDSLSARLFENIIEDEQLHSRYFSDTNGHIETLGDTYLSKIAGTASDTGIPDYGFAIAAKAGA